MTATVSAALDLHRHGLPPVPLDGKRPHAAALAAVYGSPEWSHLRERPASASDIAAWYEHAPGANVGVIVPPGLVVVDVDQPAAFTHHHPPTPCVVTGRGMHLWFRGEVDGVERHPWGELRGAGSIAVAPPSIHPTTGEPYRWAVGLDDAAPAPLPSWAVSAERGRSRRQNVLPRETQASTTNLAHDAAAVTALLSHMGAVGVHLNVERGGSSNLYCLLPEHSDGRPSAGVYVSESGAWRYRCHGYHGCGANLSLPLLFVSVVTGRTLNPDELPAPAATRWAARMWHEAGVAPVELPEVSELPAGMSAHARRLASGFVLLAALRTASGDTDAIPYTVGFAASWCGVTLDVASAALRELRTSRWLASTGPSRRGVGYLYRPPSVTGAARASPARKAGRRTRKRGSVT